MTDFEKIFHDNRDFIFRYLMKKVRNVSLAEELTQETFFRGYMNYASLREKEKISVWLCSIAKNLYYSWCREQKKMSCMDEALLEKESETLEETVVKKEMSQQIQQILQTLEEPYKEVFMFHALGDVSLKEISAIFGKSESWARVTFYRAKQKIMEKMRCEYEM